MSELPIPEMVIFISVAILYLAASIAGVVQLRARDQRYRRFMIPIVSLAVCLEAVILIFRAVAIKAVPLTGLFESMIGLTVVFGLIFLFFNIGIRQVWFSSVMVWVILAMILLAAIVAAPASEPHAAAATPWGIAHGIAMVLSGAMITFAMANAFLYLLTTDRLKQKKVMMVLGKVPNIERLKNMGLFGLNACFVTMTFGMASGIGLAVVKSASLQISAHEWLIDPKIVLIIAAWILLAAILILRRTVKLKDKTVAYITMLTFFLILFAMVGVAVFCGTKHDFTANDSKIVETRR